MVWIIAAPVLLPMFLLAKRATGKRYTELRERLGLFPPDYPPGRSTIWCHAISVGELNALLPVARAIRNQNLSHPLVITTQTEAGMETARRRFPFAHAILYAPLDHPWSVKRFVRRFQPSALLVMETGYWPNMLIQARSQGAMTILAQARMSERSFQRWRRFPTISHWLLNFFHCITVEDLPARDRFIAAGADKDRFCILPNTKFDSLETVPEDDRSMIRKKLGLEPCDPVLVAGSTHPGEERELAMAYKIIHGDYPEAILILAPRRLERLEEVRREIVDLHLPLHNWTDLHSGSRADGVVIIDTMGELARLYSIATVAFVGNSLFPPGGGHSLLEPAAQGVPLMHGPYVENVAENAHQLGLLGASSVVRGYSDVVDYVKKILESPEDARASVRRAMKWIETQSGASSTLAETLLEGLQSSKSVL